MDKYKDPAIIEKILSDSKTIAVVGLSNKPDRPSYGVSNYLLKSAYHIIPVNPAVKEVFGLKSYPDLLSITGDVDLVDIFRKSEDVGPIVEQAIAIGARAVWLQEGVINPDAADNAAAAGLDVIMDLCIKKEHAKRNIQ
jgi:predicted CoA-binding protein